VKTHHRTIDRRFVEAIRDGRKRTTIRSHATHPSGVFSPGDTLRLAAWVGRPYGAGSTQEVVGTFRVVSVDPVEIRQFGIVWKGPGAERAFTERELWDLAIGDGFPDWLALRDYFNRNAKLPMAGNLIRFEDI
jgi:hypothetical protein